MTRQAIATYLTEKLGYAEINSREYHRKGRGRISIMLLEHSMQITRNEMLVYYGDLPRSSRFLQVLLEHV